MAHILGRNVAPEEKIPETMTTCELVDLANQMLEADTLSRKSKRTIWLLATALSNLSDRFANLEQAYQTLKEAHGEAKAATADPVTP